MREEGDDRFLSISEGERMVMTESGCNPTGIGPGCIEAKPGVQGLATLASAGGS
jgi:hypothetical protein